MVEEFIWFATMAVCLLIAIPLAIAVRGSLRFASRIGAEDPVLTIAVLFFTILIFAQWRFQIAQEFYSAYLAVDSALR